MTQDVQPLTWSRRTNLEEHQQFFSKINEIIDNLAPTVDEAEAAIAQATAAIASANDAIATANAASAAASAAASQAQTAANTVAGYNTRLTAAEGDIDAAEGNIAALQGRMGTAEGKITAIEGRETGYLKKAGAAQTVTSQIMVPTTATGVRDTQIANGTRIQNDLANYAQMMRLTGNQVFIGIKKAGGAGFFRKQSASLDIDLPSAGTATDETYVLEDVHGSTVVSNFNSYTENAQTIYQISTKYPFVEDGVVKRTVGAIWLAVYKERLVLFIRFTDKNGTAHLKTISTVTENDP